MIKTLKKFDSTLARLLILAVSLALIAFEAVRAARATFYFDEANTFLNYLSSNILAIFNFNSANNHFLNTVLAKLFCAVGGTSELVLRLPNLLGIIVYLLFSFLIVDRFIKNRLMAVCGFLWLSSNPYLLEFFSLCRGYGLSLACLMAALFFFFSFLKTTTDDEAEADRRLRYSLTAAGLGVLANFNLLTVYISLVVLAFGIFIVLNAKKRPIVPPIPLVHKPPKKKKILPAGAVIAAVIFNLLVISQDFRLADRSFEPVAVKIVGIDEADKKSIEIFRVNIQNEEEMLTNQDDVWRLDKPTYFAGIKFRCSPTIFNKIKHIQIMIGPKTFTVAEAELARIKTVPTKQYSFFSTPFSLSLKRSLIPAFQPVINWSGDRALLWQTLRRLSIVLGIWALGLLALFLSGKLLERLKAVTSRQFRLLAFPTFVLGTFIGYPLYLLKSGGALWYGGRAAFIRDTVRSLINNSFYGEFYFRGQDWLVWFAICLSFLAFVVWLSLNYRKRPFMEVLPGLSIAALLVLTSGFVVLQKIILSNPYPVGRTALFFIPLFLLMVIFLFQFLLRRAAGGRVIGLSLVVILTLLSAAHLLNRASTTMIVESRIESDTKSMLKDLQQIRNKDITQYPKISLGLDSAFLPSLQYYLGRGASAWLEVRSTPPFKGNDFDYLRETSDSERLEGLGLILIKRYPISGTILLESGRE